MTTRSKKIFKIAAIISAASCIAITPIIAVLFALSFLSNEVVYYCLVLERNGNSVYAHVIQVDTGMVSPKFHVGNFVFEKSTYPIRGSGIDIPHCHMEFQDPDFLGGIYTMNLNGRIITVAEFFIEYNNKQFGWKNINDSVIGGEEGGKPGGE